MALCDIFNRERLSLKTTTTPIGVINHIRYGEIPWDYNVYKWTTMNHPALVEMRPNEFGSYDVRQKIKRGMFSWLNQEVSTHVSKQEALNILIDREIQVLRDFGGYKNELTLASLKEHLKQKSYSGRHIFGYLQKHPEALENWVAARFPQKPKAAVPVPAPR